MKACLFCGQRFSAEDWCCPSCNVYAETADCFLSFAPDLAAKNDHFCAESFEKLCKVEAASFWFRSRNRLLVWALHRYFPNAENFLELGCGTGFVLRGIQREFSGLSVSGGDIFIEGLRFAEERMSDASLFQMDAAASLSRPSLT